MAAVLKDVDAFVEHRKMLWRYLRSKLYGRDRDDIDDLLQDIAMRYWRRGIEPDVPLAYLYQIANHVLFDYWQEKHGALEVEDIGDAIEETAGAAMEDVEKDIDNERLVAYLLEPLPTTKRNVIILHKMYGYSYQDCARELDLSIHTVEKWVTMAKWILRSKVK